MSERPIQSELRRARFLDYPYRVGGSGTANTVEGDDSALKGAPSDHLRDLILQVLFTNPGERVNLPEFGVGVQRLVFAPNNEALRSSAQFLISTNLQRWLGERISVERVDASSEFGAEETVNFEIVYTVKATQERQRLTVQL